MIVVLLDCEYHWCRGDDMIVVLLDCEYHWCRGDDIIVVLLDCEYHWCRGDDMIVVFICTYAITDYMYHQCCCKFNFVVIA
jgi:hypothetical protein